MKTSVFVFLFFALTGFIHAQTAAELETLLGTERVSYAQAARFVLEAADAGIYRDPLEAFGHAMTQEWLPPKVQADDPVSLRGASVLIMRSFAIKGGLFYSIFKNPHYSYREMVFRKVIIGKSDPDETVSGSRLLQLVDRVLYLTERNELVRLDPGAEAERRRVAEAEQQRVADEINTQLAARQVQDTRASAETEGITIRLSNIAFQANSAVLEEAEQQKIREIGEILKTIPGRKIQVSGHTALAGTEEAQLRTSTDRAQAVADYLVQLGVRRRGDMSVRGYGSSRPLADNSTASGQAQNRRVEITILE
jgi:outer membrane protein OmpA-like peptidoglycan-associated protein